MKMRKLEGRQSSHSSPKKVTTHLSSDDAKCSTKHHAAIIGLDGELLKREPCVLIARNIENTRQINSLLNNLANSNLHTQTESPKRKKLNMKRPLNPIVGLVSENNKKIKVDISSSCSKPSHVPGIVVLPELFTDPNANLSSEMVAAVLPESPVAERLHTKKSLEAQSLSKLYVVVERMPSDILESNQWNDTLDTAKSVYTTVDGHTILLRGIFNSLSQKSDGNNSVTEVNNQLNDNAEHKNKNHVEKPVAADIRTSPSIDRKKNRRKQVKGNRPSNERNVDTPECPVNDHTQNLLVTDISKPMTCSPKMQGLKNLDTTNSAIKEHTKNVIMTDILKPIGLSSSTKIATQLDNTTAIQICADKNKQAVCTVDQAIPASADTNTKISNVQKKHNMDEIPSKRIEQHKKPSSDSISVDLIHKRKRQSSGETQQNKEKSVFSHLSSATNDMTSKDVGSTGSKVTDTISGRDRNKSDQTVFKIPSKIASKQDPMSSSLKELTLKNTSRFKSNTKKTSKEVHSKIGDVEHNENALSTVATQSACVNDISKLKSAQDPQTQASSEQTLPLYRYSTSTSTTGTGNLTASSNEPISKDQYRYYNKNALPMVTKQHTIHGNYMNKEKTMVYNRATGTKESIQTKPTPNENIVLPAPPGPWENNDDFDDDAISLHPDSNMFEEMSVASSPPRESINRCSKPLVSTKVDLTCKSKVIDIVFEEPDRESLVASDNKTFVSQNRNNEGVIECSSTIESQPCSTTAINQLSVHYVAPPAVQDPQVSKINYRPSTSNWEKGRDQQFTVPGFWDNVITKYRYCTKFLTYGCGACNEANQSVCGFLHQVPDVMARMSCDEIKTFLLFSKQNYYNYAVHYILLALCEALYQKTHLADPALWILLQDELVGQGERIDWFITVTLDKCRSGNIDYKFVKLVSDLICANDVMNSRWVELLSIRQYELPTTMIEKLLAECLTNNRDVVEIVKILIYKVFAAMSTDKVLQINSALFIKFQNKLKALGLTKYFEYFSSLLDKTMHPPECVPQHKTMVSQGDIHSHVQVEELATGKVTEKYATVSTHSNPVAIDNLAPSPIPTDSANMQAGCLFTNIGLVHCNRIPNSSSSAVVEKESEATHGIANGINTCISVHQRLGNMQAINRAANTQNVYTNILPPNSMHINPHSSEVVEKDTVPTHGIADDNRTRVSPQGQLGNRPMQATNPGANTRILNSVSAHYNPSGTQGCELIPRDISAGNSARFINNEIVDTENSSFVEQTSVPVMETNVVSTQGVSQVEQIRNNYHDTLHNSSELSPTLLKNALPVDVPIATFSGYGATTAFSRPLQADEWEPPSLELNVHCNKSEDVFSSHSSGNPTPRKPFTSTNKKVWGDRKFLITALEKNDYDQIFLILERWSDSQNVTFMTENLVEQWTKSNLRSCDIAFKQLVNVAVQAPVSVWEPGHKMKDVLSTIGINLIIEAIRGDADDELWAIAHNILQLMLLNNIRPFTLKATDGLSPSRQILMCSEICMNHDEMGNAVDLLEGNGLFSPDPKQWTGESESEDINTRIQFCEALLENISSQSKYLPLALRLFMGIHNTQQNLTQFQIVDLQKSINELLVCLVNQSQFIDSINILKCADWKRLRVHVMRAMLIVQIHRNMYSKTTAGVLYSNPITQLHYPEIKIQMPLVIRIKTYWLLEEMFLVLNEFFTKLSSQPFEGRAKEPWNFDVTVAFEAEKLVINREVDVAPNMIINVDGSEAAAKERVQQALKLLSQCLVLETFRFPTRISGFSVKRYLKELDKHKISH